MIGTEARAATEDEVRPERTGPSARLLVLLATVIAAAEGLFRLGHNSFWVDDGFSVAHAQLPAGSFWHITATREANGALHSLFLHGWVRLGDSEWWVRLPSVAFTVAAVPLVYLLGRRLFDDRVAVLAAFLLALNAFAVEFAQEGRVYAMALLLAVSSTYLLVRYLDDRSPGVLVAWVTVSALLGYAHFFGVLVIGAQLATVLLRRGELQTAWRRVLGGFAVIGILLSPLVAFLVSGGDKGQVETIPEITPFRFVGVFVRLAGNGGVPLFLLVVAACGIALVRHGGGLRHGIRTREQWGLALVVAWISVPILAVAVVSLVKPLFGARYFLITVPAIALLTALGATAVRNDLLRKGFVALLVVLSVVATGLWYTKPPREDVRGATAYVLESAEAGDGVVFLPWFMRVSFGVYAEHQETQRDRIDPLYPGSGWDEFEPVDEPGIADEATAASLLTGQDRVWVIERDDTYTSAEDADLGAFLHVLRESYEPVSDEQFVGIDVTLWERR